MEREYPDEYIPWKDVRIWTVVIGAIVLLGFIFGWWQFPREDPGYDDDTPGVIVWAAN